MYVCTIVAVGLNNYEQSKLLNTVFTLHSLNYFSPQIDSTVILS